MSDPVNTRDPAPIPAEVTARIDLVQYEEDGGFPVEQGYVWTTCAAVQNGNPLFWEDDVAAALTDGAIAPPRCSPSGSDPTTGRRAAPNRPSHCKPTST